MKKNIIVILIWETLLSGLAYLCFIGSQFFETQIYETYDYTKYRLYITLVYLFFWLIVGVFILYIIKKVNEFSAVHFILIILYASINAFSKLFVFAINGAPIAGIRGRYLIWVLSDEMISNLGALVLGIIIILLFDKRRSKGFLA